MKKSELKRLIRECVKELLNEGRDVDADVGRLQRKRQIIKNILRKQGIREYDKMIQFLTKKGYKNEEELESLIINNFQ
jgi:hypothetical protein